MAWHGIPALWTRLDSEIKQVYIEKKKYPYECFTNLREEKSIPMTALWCPSFSNHG